VKEHKESAVADKHNTQTSMSVELLYKH